MPVLDFGHSIHPKNPTGANKTLQCILAIFSFYLLERVLIGEFDGPFIYKYTYARNAFYYLIGPLTYIYIRRSLFDNNGQYTLPFVHYLPALLYLLYSLVHIAIYDSISDPCNYLRGLLLFTEVSCFVSISAYLVKSIGLLAYYIRNEERELSFNQRFIFYLKVMLFCLSVYMLFWFLGILERFVIKLPLDIGMIYDISCLIFAVQIYIVGFYSLKYPELFKIPFRTADKRKMSLREEELQTIQHRIDDFFKRDLGYCRSDLSLTILANEIDTTNNKLSWVLNNAYGKSFYELVNQYRVDAFFQKIKERKHKEYTVASIGFDVGFKSKSTFYKAFKEITGSTPTEYIKKMEKSSSE